MNVHRRIIIMCLLLVSGTCNTMQLSTEVMYESWNQLRSRPVLSAAVACGGLATTTYLYKKRRPLIQSIENAYNSVTSAHITSIAVGASIGTACGYTCHLLEEAGVAWQITWFATSAMRRSLCAMSCHLLSGLDIRYKDKLLRRSAYASDWITYNKSMPCNNNLQH